MRASWRIASISGIDIELHISFLLFILLFVFFDISFIPTLLILFVSVTLHELVHSLVAKRHGIVVKKIILLPIGGMAMMKGGELKPYVEFKMAIAGPMFNFLVCALIVLGALLFGLGDLFLGWTAWNLVLMGSLTIDPASFFLSTVFWLNWLLGAFNLFVPAIPLDGGRVFRSLLAMFIDYVKATRIATFVSTIVTIFLFIFALLSFNIILLIIAVFIYLGASAEMEHALSAKFLSEVRVRDLVRHNFLVVDENDYVEGVLANMVASRSLTAIVQTKRGHRITSLYDIQGVPKSKWRKTKIRLVSKRFKPLAVNHSAMYALRRMLEHGTDALPVMESGVIIGFVFRQDIENVFQIMKVVG